MKKISALLLLIFILASFLPVLYSCGPSDNTDDGGNGNNNVSDKTDVLGTGACEYLETRDVSGRDIKYVEMCVEGYGRVVIMLDATTAPITVANFISLIEEGFYDGLTFHRIIEGFMIQGGDPKGNGTGGSENEIIGEFDENGHENDISHIKGVISMARAGGDETNNYGHDTASSQFFICNDDASSSLDGKYAAFGYVVEGLSVIDEITSSTIKRVQAYYGDQYIYWLYYGNGALDAALQPKIKYVKLLDSWENK